MASETTKSAKSSTADASGRGLRLATEAAQGILACWLLLAIELVVVGVFRQARFGSVWEAQMGVLWLAPTVLLAVVPGALLGVALGAAIRRGDERPVRVLSALAFGAFGGVVGWGVSGGRLLAEAGRRPLFVGTLVLVGAAGAFWGMPALRRLVEKRPWLLALLAALAVVLTELLNRFVLVRLYPAFHLGLTALALCFAPLAWPRTAKPVRGWRLPAVVGGMSVVCAALLLPSARRLARFDNVRLLLLDEAPMLGEGVRLASRVAPPPPLLPTAAECFDADCARPPVATAGPSWRGRDLLLITIDAVRADHVGAYGYARKTTPALDQLAKTGARFEYAYSPTPHTSYAVTSLMTGKYMRPLLLQGVAEDSATWATLLRTYEYKTAGFYPPAIFFIDPGRFTRFRDEHLGFEYRKVEFLEGKPRVAQVTHYLDEVVEPSQRVFLWVHLFAPHEPYVPHAGHDFGSRDVDRYDSELAFADQTVGELVREVRQRRPRTVVVVSSDHGEEFGDHGGRYHGTTVYEEQVRVPLVINAPGAVAPRVVGEPVQLVDLLPTTLNALEIPVPPRVRGRDLGPLLMAPEGTPPGPGFALAETDEQSLLAVGSERLVCARQIGACRLYDVKHDPAQTKDLARERQARAAELRRRLRELGESHGRFEGDGGKSQRWPPAILRGISGDGEAAGDVAALLDDADVRIRRKAAEVLFELQRPDSAAALRLAIGRDEDREVRAWCALALTRLGQGAPLVFELIEDRELRWRRLAALALGESGDDRGEATLIAWWKDEASLDYQRSRQLLRAFAAIRSEDAVWPLVQRLDDVRLRPHVARALAKIGEEVARVPLAKALEQERYQGARIAITQALLELGAEGELVKPLVRFLGVPDPLPGGLGVAREAGILARIGGPGAKELKKLRSQSNTGVAFTTFIPKGGNGRGVRFLVRARTRAGNPGKVHLGARLPPKYRLNREGEPHEIEDVPQLNQQRMLSVEVPVSDQAQEVHALVPEALGAAPGKALQLVVFADHNVELEAVALVPLSDELPPPKPKPWQKPE